jgi:hypothetical protein
MDCEFGSHYMDFTNPAVAFSKVFKVMLGGYWLDSFGTG